MVVTRGQAKSAPVDGVVIVRRPGSPADESAVACRTLAPLIVAGDWLRITEGGGVLYADMLLGAAPAPLAPPSQSVTPEPTAEVRATLPPVWSGTWRGSAWRGDMDDLVQGDGGFGLSQGAAWYGRKLTASGTLQSASVSLRRLAYGSYGDGDTPTMRLLAGFERTPTYPDVLATAPGPVLSSRGVSADWPLPGAWVAQINAGAAGGIGIGISGREPYMRLEPPRLTGLWH